MQGIRRVAVLATALAALLIPGSAAADWESPQDISGHGSEHSNVDVAVAADGSATAVWLREFRVSTLNERSAVQARHFAPDGTPGPIRTLSGPVDGGDTDEFSPAVAIDDMGRSVVVWERGNEILFVRLEQDGLPSGDGIQTLSQTGEVSSPEVAVSPTGDAVATWQRFDDDTNDSHAIEAVQIPEGTSFPGAPIEVVSFTDVDSDAGDFFQLSEGPRIATAPNGDSVITWLKFECQCSSSVSSYTFQARRLESDGSLGTLHDLSPQGPANNTAAPDVAIDDAGNATVSYTNPESPPDPQARVRRVLANDSLGPERVLTDEATTSISTFDLDVDVAPTGEATVAWVDCTAPCFDDVGEYARLAADGTVSIPATQFTADDPDGLALGVDDSNNAYIFWNTSDVSGTIGHARRVTSAGTAEAVQDFPESETTDWHELTADAGGAVALGAWVIEDPETADFEDPFVQGVFNRPPASPPPPPPPPTGGGNNPSANQPDDTAEKQQRCATLHRKARNADKKYRRKALKRKLRRLGC